MEEGPELNKADRRAFHFHHSRIHEGVASGASYPIPSDRSSMIVAITTSICSYLNIIGGNSYLLVSVPANQWITSLFHEPQFSRQLLLLTLFSYLW